MIAIKPSGVDYDLLSSEDIVIVDLNGKIVEGDKKPSSDTLTHIEIYKNFKDVAAVVHTHSTYATAFSQAKKEIVCFGTTHADNFHGPVPFTRNLTEDEINGQYEENTGKVIVERFNELGIHPLEIPVCLVASHGPFVWGKSIQGAVENSVVLEEVAKMNISTLNINDAVQEINKILLDKHYLRKHGSNAYYGQRSS